MKQYTITAYSFDELSEEAKERAINDCLKDITEFDPEQLGEYAKKALQKIEQLQTPWFYPAYLWEYGQKQIIEDFLQKEKYSKDGRIFDL